MSYQQPGEYYKHSGKFPLYSLAYVFILGGAAALLMGIIYSALLHFLPYIIIKIAAWVGAIFATGGLGYLIVKWAKVRNMAIAFIYGTTIGLFTLYFAWLVALILLGAVDAIIYFLDPVALVKFIIFLSGEIGYEYDGTAVNKWIVLIFWGVEALGFLLVPGFITWSMIEDKPFDEETKEWLMKEEVVEPLSLSELGADILKAKAEKGDFAPIHDLEKLPMGAAHFWKLKLLYNESQTLFVMALKSVTVTVNNEGNKTTAEEYLVKNLIVDKATFADLLQVGREPAATGPIETEEAADPEPASREPGQISPEAEDDPYSRPE